MNIARFKALVSIACSLALLFVVVSCKSRQKALVEEDKTPDFTLNDINGG